MKDNREKFDNLQYATAGKKKSAFYTSFNKKDKIIKNIEIIVACIVAFIAGLGIYGLSH